MDHEAVSVARCAAAYAYGRQIVPIVLIGGRDANEVFPGGSVRSGVARWGMGGGAAVSRPRSMSLLSHLALAYSLRVQITTRDAAALVGGRKGDKFSPSYVILIREFTVLH